MTYNGRVDAPTALAEVASLPVSNPKLAILSACCSGQLIAHGCIHDQIRWRGREDKIPPRIWQEFCRLSKRREDAWANGEDLVALESQFDWAHGRFELLWPTEQGPTVLHITGVWFLRTEFDLHFRSLTAVTAQAVGVQDGEISESSPQRANKGGRPPSPDGQAIGAVALRLAGLAENQQGRSTTESVATELKVEYAKLGASVNDQSLNKHAQGLLRALRAHPISSV